MEEEIQFLRTGEERRGSCASSNGCCFDPAMREQVFECGATQTEHFIQPMQPEFYRRFKAQDALEQRAGEEDWDEEVWLEPAVALLRKKVREEWTDKHRNVARKLFLEGGWVQKRLFNVG